MKPANKPKISIPNQEDKGYFTRMLVYVVIGVICVVAVVYATVNLVETIEQNASLSSP